MARQGAFRQGRNHLPPGHPPGPQSRRANRGAPIGMIVLTLGALGMTAGAVILFATASKAKSPSGARTGGVIFIVAAVVLMLLVVWVWWRRHPRQAHHLELRVEPIEARRGGIVTATVVIANTAKLGEKLELGLLCTEYYDMKTDHRTPRTALNEQRVLQDDRRVLHLERARSRNTAAERPLHGARQLAILLRGWCGLLGVARRAA